MCPSILMVLLEFTFFWSVISLDLFDFTVRSQYASFLIVASMVVVRFLADVRSFSL